MQSKHANAKRVIVNHKKLKEIISFFESKNLTVVINNTKNYHMTITGELRIVQFYPTTGTVNCQPCKKYKAVKLRDSNPEFAMNRVVDLANLGW
jgi:hypothetical protein